MHHIERLIFEHQTPTADGATAQQTAVSRWLSAAFLPMLDSLFSDMTPDDRVLKLDRLVVEVPNVATDISESALLDLCQQAIHKALQTEIGRLLTLDTEGGVFRETETVAFEAFVYFLKNGYLPTAFRVKNEAEWLFRFAI